MDHQLVEGPTWTCSGLNESAGLYPLRVEPSVGRLVERLLPGVITTTTGARYYGLHTLACAGLAGADTIKSREGIDDGAIECGGDNDTLIADALPKDDLAAGSACETVRR